MPEEDEPVERESGLRVRVSGCWGRAPAHGRLGVCSKAEFDDPRLEWRRLFLELLERFFLALVAAAVRSCTGRARSVLRPECGGRTDGDGDHLFMGAVPRPLDPAVSLAFVLRRDFRGSVCLATSSSARERPWPACSWRPCSATSSILVPLCRVLDMRHGRPC